MLGVFSGNGLGMGVAMYLKNEFSGPAAEIERSMQSLEQNADIMITKMQSAMDRMKLGFGLTSLGALITAPFFMGVKAASDYTEALNKVNVVFQDQAGIAKKFVEEQSAAFGFSEAAALQAIGTYGNLFTALGAGRKEAAELSVGITKLAADLASFNDARPEDTTRALRSALTGEFESVKKFGISIRQEMIKQRALELGLTKSLKDRLDPLTKMRSIYSIILDQTKNAQGDFLRTNKDFANSTRRFDANIENFKKTFGEIAKQVLLPLLNFANDLLQIFKKIAETKLGKTILWIVFALGAFLTVAGLGLMVSGAFRLAIWKLAGTFNAATKATLINTIATKGAIAGFRKMAVAAWASLGPYALIAAALIGLVLLFRQIYKGITKGEESTVKWMTALGAALGPIGWIITAIAGLKRGFKELAEWDGNNFKGGVIGYFMKLAGFIKAAVQIWKSFNGETFTLTDTLARKLESMGILKPVLKMGAVLVRIKAFVTEIVKGFLAGFRRVRQMFVRVTGTFSRSFGRVRDSIMRSAGRIKQALQPLIDIFHRITNGIFRNIGSLETWKKVGKFVASALILGFEMFATVVEGIANFIAYIIENAAKALEKVTSYLPDADSNWNPANWVKGAYNYVMGSENEQETKVASRSGTSHHFNTSKTTTVVNNSGNMPEMKAGDTVNLTVQLDSQVITDKVLENVKLEAERQ